MEIVKLETISTTVLRLNDAQLKVSAIVQINVIFVSFLIDETHKIIFICSALLNSCSDEPQCCAPLKGAASVSSHYVTSLSQFNGPACLGLTVGALRCYFMA